MRASERAMMRERAGRGKKEGEEAAGGEGDVKEPERKGVGKDEVRARVMERVKQGKVEEKVRLRKREG